MQKKNFKVKIRNWIESDITQLVACYQKVYAQDFKSKPENDKRLFIFNFQNFPEGQLLAEVNGEIVGYACSMIVQLDKNMDYYTYDEITGGGAFTTHTPSGDTLYGADMAVIPEFRGQGIAGLLYKGRKKILRKYNLKRMVAHGRLPNYSKYAGKYTPEQYIEKVKLGELKDLALNAHYKANYEVKKILLDHMSDGKSLDYSTWLEYNNPDYNEVKRKLAAPTIQRPNRRMRVCTAQFAMRSVANWGEFERNAKFFIDVAHTYSTHFLVFPELFTAQLFSCFDPELDDIASINILASYLDQYITFFQEQAVKHSMFIIAGSTPRKMDNKIYNSSYLFTPSGKYHFQDKLHITPTEREMFGISPGDGVKIFDTSYGKIAIVICYDIEFPELSRILSQAGVEVIFVPFSTDERKAYNRIRYTAQARAVENYVYVAIAGNVGNLPNVKSYLINYAQSAILTPSDFGFPNNSIEGEADPNTETVVLADLDINNLMVQRETGTVRPFYDRRPDLYDLSLKVNLEVIKCE